MVETRLILTCDHPGCGAEREIRVKTKIAVITGPSTFKDRVKVDCEDAEKTARRYDWKLDSATGCAECPSHRRPT